MHQYQCMSHCHFHRQIQQTHPDDTALQQVDSVQPVCSQKKMPVSIHLGMLTVNVNSNTIRLQVA